MHTYIHTYMYIHTYKCIFVYIYIYIYICIHRCIDAHLHIESFFFCLCIYLSILILFWFLKILFNKEDQHILLSIYQFQCIFTLKMHNNSPRK